MYYESGPSPVDIDDIRDYHAGQRLLVYFRLVRTLNSEEYQTALVKMEREKFKSRVGFLILWLELFLIIALAIYVVYT